MVEGEVRVSEGQESRPLCHVKPLSTTAARNRLTRYEQEIYNPAMAEVRAMIASGGMPLRYYQLEEALTRVHRWVREKAVEAGEAS